MSPAPSAGQVGVDACALLPTALLPTILDGELAFPTPVPSSGWAAGQCAWNSPSTSFILRVGTADSITAFGDRTAPDAAALLAAFKKQASAAGTAPDVAGIGDAAVMGTGGMAAALGGTYVEITRLRLTDIQLITIAKLVIGRL